MSRGGWSAEDILLFKLLYLRPKNKVDIELRVAVRGRELDLSYVGERLLEAVDEGDKRWIWWSGILRSHGLEPEHGGRGTPLTPRSP